jgi:phospholipase C
MSDASHSKDVRSRGDLSRERDVTRGNTRLAVISVAAVLAAGLASDFPAAAGAGNHDKQSTATPIEHLVAIFQENVSFDHYFATYPKAANPAANPPSAPHRTLPR